MYTLGIDYGTLSARAVVFDVETGREAGSATYEYPHGVMDETLFGKKLPKDFALQHPMDYLQALSEAVPAAMAEAGIGPQDIVGVGVDFTACTLIPLDENNVPLCFYEKYKERPHAYAKLWKHHAAAKQAERFTALAKERKEPFFEFYGGTVSSEWLFPKVMEILEEDEEMYNATADFMEAGDWIVYILTGEISRSICQAGFKGCWNKKDGYPSKQFLKELDPRLENVLQKLPGDIKNVTECAGKLCYDAAELTGLRVGTPVSVCCIDAHSALLALGIVDAGKMMLVIGTSGCHIIMSKEGTRISGISGTVEDGFVPGYHIMEAGQACVGDHFDWFVKNCVPASYENEAAEKGISIHKLLREKAMELKVGESGLIALDWFNGNRSVLCDAQLSGMILGYTLRTKPEEVYRALIEATAYGTKMIFDTFEEAGTEVNAVYAAGGIANKDDMLMQIYADVTNKPFYVSDVAETCALGAAILGSVAAGSEKGGYDNVNEAVKAMAQPYKKCYQPIKENVQAYAKLYQEYKTLHDYFGRGGNDVMKRLKG